MGCMMQRNRRNKTDYRYILEQGVRLKLAEYSVQAGGYIKESRPTLPIGESAAQGTNYGEDAFWLLSNLQLCHRMQCWGYAIALWAVVSYLIYMSWQSSLVAPPSPAQSKPHIWVTGLFIKRVVDVTGPAHILYILGYSHKSWEMRHGIFSFLRWTA